MTPERKRLIEKARSLRAFFFDVDGTLTDGCVYVDEDGNEVEWEQRRRLRGEVSA